MIIKKLYLLPVALFCSTMAFAQLQNSNWVFGSDLGMNFSTGTPTLFDSQCSPLATAQPAVISDDEGNLICYTDGDKVYNSNHEVIENGDLSMAPENLIVPAPGDPDKFYLFRSTSSELMYCIIDMSLNGGSGGIETGNIDINIEGLLCQITATIHPNGTDVWIITSDNFNGTTDNIRYTSYLLNEEGLTEVDSIENYYIFGGWYSAPDDLRISPDCTKLATTYKGHYLVLCRFNNETGDLYDLLESNIDMQTSFGSTDLDQIEFSPNSNLLYTLGDQYVIKQYNVEEWNASTIATTVSSITNLTYSDVWTDIKLGPDGVLYLYNVMEDQIDIISNPDDPGNMIEIEEGFFTELSLSSFFPNTANFLCTTVLDISVEHQYECLGDSTEFWYYIIQEPDSVAWTFDDPNSGSDNTSSLDSPIHVFTEPGEYLVLFDYYLDGELFTIEHPVTIYEYPSVNLPATVTICSGDSYTLDAGPSPQSNEWSTGASTQTIQVTLPGTYSVDVFNGSCMASDATIVEVIPSVDLSILSTYELCEGEILTLDLSDSGGEDFEWSNGSLNPVLVITSPGLYSVSAQNECSSESMDFEVNYIVFPAALLPGDIVLCTIEPVDLEVNYSGGNVLWSTGETDSEITVLESGTYSVTVSDGECSATDEINVAIFEYIPLSDIEMPNIFTPDANGKNEVFRPFLKDNPSFPLCAFGGIEVDLKIYDRWGNLHSEESCSWNAKLKSGVDAADEVFYYIVEIKTVCDAQDEEEKREGYVHVVRR